VTSQRRRVVPSPATVVAVLALFLALGGSAFAVGERLDLTGAAQPRCANGAVRGFATVTGNPSAGIANVPGQFTSNRSLFRRAFNCTGRATQVRRTETGVFEVRFVGSSSQTATASGFGDSYATVEPIAPGTFRVIVHPPGRDDRADLGFEIIAV
jgi:hypothetical protein